MNKPRVQRDWPTKISAGLLLGLCLALTCSAIFFENVSGMSDSIKAQLTMWIVAPIWLAVLSLSFLFRDGKTAWNRLTALNLIVIVLFFLLRF